MLEVASVCDLPHEKDAESGIDYAEARLHAHGSNNGPTYLIAATQPDNS
jgi:hypothetical protein